MSHRNEQARARHRKLLKQEQTSLSSLPMDPKRHLNLQNHFGWTTLQKCQVGDGSVPRYPQVVQYFEKPDRYGPDYRKVTYIMYLEGKQESELGKGLGKQEREIQTSPKSLLQVIEEPEKKKEQVITECASSDSKKRKLIGSFYSNPEDNKMFRPIDDDAYRQPEQNPVVVENYTTDYVPSTNKKPKKEKSRNKPKSWQLRAAAGAEKGSFMEVEERGRGEFDGDSDEEMKQGTVTERENKYLKIRNSRGYKPAPKISPKGEVLFDSPTKTNEYLYISSRRAARMLRDRS